MRNIEAGFERQVLPSPGIAQPSARLNLPEPKYYKYLRYSIVGELPAGDRLNISAATNAGFGHRHYPLAIAASTMAKDIDIVCQL